VGRDLVIPTHLLDVVLGVFGLLIADPASLALILDEQLRWLGVLVEVHLLREEIEGHAWALAVAAAVGDLVAVLPGETVVLEVLISGLAGGATLLGHRVEALPFAITVMCLIKLESKRMDEALGHLPASGGEVALEVPLTLEDGGVLLELRLLCADVLHLTF